VELFAPLKESTSTSRRPLRPPLFPGGAAAEPPSPTTQRATVLDGTCGAQNILCVKAQLVHTVTVFIWSQPMMSLPRCTEAYQPERGAVRGLKVKLLSDVAARVELVARTTRRI